MFHVLRINGRNDGFYCHSIDHLLITVLLLVDLVVLLEVEELATLGTALDFWIEEIGPFLKTFSAIGGECQC